MNRILSVVLALVMACAMLPAFGETAAPATLEDVLAKLDANYAAQVTTAISELGDNPDVGNRSCGSAAEAAAAQIIANELYGMGFETVNVDQFTADTWSFNKGRVYYTDADGAEQYVLLGGFATNLTFEGDVQLVYAGRGTMYDYEGLDVNGKVVLIDINQAEDWWVEIPVYEAYTRGALATLVCNVDGYAIWDNDTIGSQDICGPAFAPAFAVSINAADALKSVIAANGGEATVRLDVDSVVKENGTSQNVWAEIPGTTDEVIYFFAHYDGYYHSFFDDAEGVGSVLAIAKAFKDSGYTPSRTLRFVLHGAEEWGKTDTEYDWSNGAYHMIYDIHPEWAENAFVILNIDGMYPVQGHETFSLACVNELTDWATPIADAVFEGSSYGIETKAYTSAWTEDFSYVRKGVPSIVASHAEPEEIYHGTAYHSSMDHISLGVDMSAWETALKLFATLCVEFDNVNVRPMNFTCHFEAMEEVYAGETEIDFEAVYAATGAVDAMIAAANENGSVDTAFDVKLYNLYNYITDNFFAFDYEDNLIFTFEMNEWNIEALEAAIELITEGDAAAAYEEVLYGIDYNWYAYDFSAETYAYMLDKMVTKAVGTWGEGMIKYMGENLWDVIHSIADEKAELDDADYTAELETLTAALENQYAIRAEIEADLVNALNTVIAMCAEIAG